MAEDNPFPTNDNLFKTVEKLADGKTKIPQALRDRFLFAAIADLRQSQKDMAFKLDKIWPIYQFLAVIGGLSVPIWAGLIILFIRGDLFIGRGP